MLPLRFFRPWKENKWSRRVGDSCDGPWTTPLVLCKPFTYMDTQCNSSRDISTNMNQYDTDMKQIKGEKRE